MRILSTITLLYPSMTWATMHLMEKQFNSLIAHKLGITNPNAEVMRSLSVSTSLRAIENYGCWCYFQDDHGKGRGQPANEVDGFCKTLHDGYECAILDGNDEQESPECVPWKIDYNATALMGNDQDMLEIECKYNNPASHCAARACVIENYFILNIFAAFLEGDNFDPSLKHELGHFDPESECSAPGEGGSLGEGGTGSLRQKSCCGFYPIRFPYFHIDGNRGCCGTKTYNAHTYSCCEDGSDYSVKYSCL